MILEKKKNKNKNNDKKRKGNNNWKLKRFYVRYSRTNWDVSDSEDEGVYEKRKRKEFIKRGTNGMRFHQTFKSLNTNYWVKEKKWKEKLKKIKENKKENKRKKKEKERKKARKEKAKIKEKEKKIKARERAKKEKIRLKIKAEKDKTKVQRELLRKRYKTLEKKLELRKKHEKWKAIREERRRLEDERIKYFVETGNKPRIIKPYDGCKIVWYKYHRNLKKEKEEKIIKIIKIIDMKRKIMQEKEEEERKKKRKRAIYIQEWLENLDPFDFDLSDLQDSDSDYASDESDNESADMWVDAFIDYDAIDSE